MVEKSGGVCTIGTMAYQPNAVNVIPSEAKFTIDLRNPDKARLDGDEEILAAYLEQLAQEEGVEITAKRMTCFDPVPFDEGICQKVEKAAAARNLKCRRMVSGAGQDAQMMARICPTAMIFVPSVKGISHNPAEYTPDQACINGANVFLDVVREMIGA